MVRGGHALDYARHSRGRYAAAEREARAARRGLWAGTFETPATWRQQNATGTMQWHIVVALVLSSPVTCRAAVAATAMTQRPRSTAALESAISPTTIRLGGLTSRILSAVRT